MIRPAPRRVMTCGPVPARQISPRGVAREGGATMPGRAQVDGTMGQLEELWGHLDTLFDAIETAGDWGHQHGPNWTFADVPYHLAYFDRELVVRALELGAQYPEAE